MSAFFEFGAFYLWAQVMILLHFLEKYLRIFPIIGQKINNVMITIDARLRYSRPMAIITVTMLGFPILSRKFRNGVIVINNVA